MDPTHVHTGPGSDQARESEMPYVHTPWQRRGAEDDILPCQGTPSHPVVLLELHIKEHWHILVVLSSFVRVLCPCSQLAA